MDIMIYIMRNLEWFMFQIYGNLTWYGDLLLANIGKIAEKLVGALVYNPFVDTIMTNLTTIIWLVVPIFIILLGYQLILFNKGENNGDVIKRIFKFAIYMALLPTFVGTGRWLISNSSTISNGLLGQQSNQVMGLATALITVNPDFINCTNDPASKTAKGEKKEDPGVYDQTASRAENTGTYIIGEYFIDTPNFDWWNSYQTSAEKITGGFRDEPTTTTIQSEEEIQTQLPTHSSVENRYKYTACTTKQGGKVNTLFHFKWNLPNFLVGIAFSILVLFSAIMALMKIFDSILEFLISILTLFFFAPWQLWEPGEEYWRKAIRAFWESATGTFQQIFITSLLCWALLIIIPLVPTWVEEIFSTNILMKGVAATFFYIAIMLTFFQMILRGPDVLTKITGYDTGVSSSGAAMAVSGGLGYAAGKAGGALWGATGRKATDKAKEKFEDAKSFGRGANTRIKGKDNSFGEDDYAGGITEPDINASNNTSGGNGDDVTEPTPTVSSSGVSEPDMMANPNIDEVGGQELTQAETMAQKEKDFMEGNVSQRQQKLASRNAKSTFNGYSDKQRMNALNTIGNKQEYQKYFASGRAPKWKDLAPETQQQLSAKYYSAHTSNEKHAKNTNKSLLDISTEK